MDSEKDPDSWEEENIATLADWVKNDLLIMGYENVYVSDTRPINLREDQRLICMRRGETDFHFMRYHPEGDFWTHSAMPSDIAPLTKAHYVFLGYFDENGKQYYDGNMVGTCQWDKQTDAFLYARWEAAKYNIQYCNLQFMGQTANVYWAGAGSIENLNEYQYGVGLNLENLKRQYVNRTL